MNATIHDPEKLFADISAFIADSKAQLESGKLLQMDGLEQNVQSLCESVLRLSQDDRIKHAELLQTLLKDLTELGEALVVKRDSVANEIISMSDHKKAHVAYKVADSRDDFGKKKQE